MMLIKLYPLLVLVSIFVFISGCQVFRSRADVVFTSGATVDSLSSEVSFLFATNDRSISGRGILMFHKPDQIRVILLSPFGSVLQEVYVDGEQVTIIDAGNGVAFRGNYLDLPDKGEFRSWRHINWLINMEPFDSSRRTEVIERTNRFGHSEKATFENGLLISKTIASGGTARYGKYTAINGAPLPQEITYETAAEEKITIYLENPEINIPFKEDAFTPDLSKLRVYPLSVLK